MIIFIIFVGMMLFFEYRLNEKRITPLFLLGGMYFLGVIIANTIGVMFNYDSVLEYSMFYDTIFIFIIFIVGILMLIINRNEITHNVNIENEHIRINVLYVIYLFCCLAYLFDFINCINGFGILEIKGKSSGIYGHLGLAAISISPVFFSLWVKKRMLKYIVPVIIILLITIFFAKYYASVLIVVTMIYMYDYREIALTRIMKLIMVMGCIAVILFSIIYDIVPTYMLSEFNVENISNAMPEAMEHLLYYYISPFIAQNTYFIKGDAADPLSAIAVLFSPINTIIEFISGDHKYVNIIMADWASIGTATHKTITNVGGIFSEVVYWVGDYAAYLFIFCLASIIYWFYYQRVYKGIFKLTSSFFMGIWLLCFFCNYFTLFTIFEMLIISFLIDVLFLNRVINEDS